MAHWRGKRSDVPDGAAKAGRTLERLASSRARDSVEKHGGVDPAAFEKLCGLLRYVDGDYQRSRHVPLLRKELWSAAAAGRTTWQSHPSLFELVVDQLGKVRLLPAVGVIIEKPFGRDSGLSA